MVDRRGHEVLVTGARLTLASTADLGAARSEVRALLRDERISAEVAADTVLALSELLTNALAAADPGSSVIAIVAVRQPVGGAVPGAREGARREIEIEVRNVGLPVPGRLQVDRYAATLPSQRSGRGLALAARLGDAVVLEGQVGGTTARFVRVVDG